MALIHSPFKFLDPYNKDDDDIFFGREDYVERLYQYVNKNRLVLVYGQSGTGKTSLVQCGLANRFDVTDWIPFFIRRGMDINASLIEVLANSKALGRYHPDEEFSTEQLTMALERMSTRYLRPVYLIFDQFEELLIQGGEEEKKRFMQILSAIFFSEYTQSCNLIFILREEYFAWLDAFEELIPGFSDRRLRVEPMRPNKVSEVIRKSCDHYNIQLENPTLNAQQIIDTLISKNGISLPYLQVYLDQLWRDDFKRGFPGGWEGKGYPPLKFGTREINDFGKIQDVLERFLTERRYAIDQELKTLDDDIPEDVTVKVLDAFVTDEGTKLSVTYKMNGDHVELTSQAPEYIRNLPENVRTICLQQLEKNRILRSDGDSFELAHDILADLIDKQRSDSQRRLNDVRRKIRSAFQEFPQTQEFLNAKQVAIYEDAIDQLNLDDNLVTFFEDSKQYRRREAEKKLHEAEQIAKEQRELREQAELSYSIAQKKTKLARIRSRIAMIMAVISIGFLGFIWSQNRRLQNSTAEIQKKKDSLQKSQNTIVSQKLNLQEEIINKTNLEMQQLRSKVDVFKNANELSIAKKMIEAKMAEINNAYSKDSNALYISFTRQLDSLRNQLVNK